MDAHGFAAGVPLHASPHHDARPHGEAVSLLVVHSISLPPGRFGGRAVDDLFTGTLDCAADPAFEALRGLRVSAHFVIDRGGRPVQYVATHARAWHAGVSRWRGRERCNDFSIGIELEGTDTGPFEAAQYATLAALVRALRAAHPIVDIVGHADIAPGRKTDPGAGFDWARLRAVIGAF
ncbi:MAG: 1,6-anhydro-N-acetylmuramyl-L-alanine amidase AmpD [Burkholderiales bacterium]|nr:1,6-anhydro-N-acetylmuramyl-L-alanine amidase AmpD [Burkholderiales bacterium]